MSCHTTSLLRESSVRVVGRSKVVYTIWFAVLRLATAAATTYAAAAVADDGQAR